MIDFPATTAVHRRMPKEAFYKHLPLTKVLKEKIVSDVDKIFVENSLTKDNLNLTAESEIKEILLVSLFLKKQEFDAEIIEALATQNPHKLIFLLIYEHSGQQTTGNVVWKAVPHGMDAVSGYRTESTGIFS